MREAAFVQRNRAKWQRLEQVVAHRDKDIKPDEASTLYIELTDDLSYARTFYPGAQVTTYLNTLAARMHQHVYRNQRTASGRFLTFWGTELPLLMAATRKQLAVAFGVFAVAVLIGGLSAHYDPTFARLILGDGYVDMTLENIKSGEPMAVYGNSPMMDMFFGITFNNIMVSLYAFAMGLLLSYGTWLILLQNGIMLGAFQYFMHANGVLRESVLSIWLHGTIEISSIVIAGAAGIVMGNGILFPGTYTRLASFRKSALTGLKIVMGLVPCFILAGFIESFITRRSPDMPVWLSAGIIGASLAFIIGYFILYPTMLNDVRMPIELRKQRDFSAVISTGFQFIRENWKTLYRPLVFICMPVYLIASLLFGTFFRTVMGAMSAGNTQGMLSSMGSMFFGYILMGLAMLLMYALVFEYMRFYMLNRGLAPTTAELWRETRKQLLAYFAVGFLAGIICVMGFFLLIIPGIYFGITFVMAFPLLAFERASVGDCISRSFKLISGNWWRTFGLVIVLTMLISTLSYIIYLPFLLITGFGTMSGIDSMNDPGEMATRMGWFMTIFMAVAGVVSVLMQPFVQVPLAMHALSLIEEKEGRGLMQQVDNINFGTQP